MTAGFDVAIDRPFSGALVPGEFLHRDQRIAALMIELNRSLYMDEQTGERLVGFDIFRMRLHSVLHLLIATATNHLHQG